MRLNGVKGKLNGAKRSMEQGSMERETRWSQRLNGADEAHGPGWSGWLCKGWLLSPGGFAYGRQTFQDMMYDERKGGLLKDEGRPLWQRSHND